MFGRIAGERVGQRSGQQEGVEPPKLETVITISGYDLTAYRQFLVNNPIEVEGVLRLSEAFQNPEDALKAENVTFWQNGVEIPASLVPKELLTPDKVAVLDEDGTMHILITPKIEGTAESVSAAGEKLDTSFVTTSVSTPAFPSCGWPAIPSNQITKFSSSRPNCCPAC